MAKSSHEEGQPATPPFLVKTYDLVSDEATSAIVSWGEGNASFVVWRPDDFARELLPRYFKHNKFPSFIRQLNTYGFKKLNPESWEFAHKDGMFLRHRPDLLAAIRPRNSPKSAVTGQSSPRHSVSATAAGVLGSLAAQVDSLKREKLMLTKELIRLAQLLDGSGSELRRMRAALEATETRQHQMMAFLNQIVRNPAVLQRYLPTVSYPSDEVGFGRKRHRMETIEENDNAHTPACLDPISSIMPCQPGTGGLGAYPPSRWDHMPLFETSTPPLFNAPPVDPRSLEEAFMARGPSPAAYSTARVLEVPSASLAGEQRPISDTAASDSILIPAPEQQGAGGAGPRSSRASLGEAPAWQQDLPVTKTPRNPVAAFTFESASEASSGKEDGSFVGRVRAIPCDVGKSGIFGYLYSDMSPGTLALSAPCTVAAGTEVVTCTGTVIEPVYGKLAATDAVSCVPTSGMDAKAELRFSAMNAQSATEEAAVLERSGSLAAFNDIMHACLQLSPDEMLQIPPLSLAPEQLHA